MRKRTLLFVIAFVVLLMPLTATSVAAAYGRAEIWIPEKDRPLDVYKRVCEREVIPPFAADLKKKNPDLDEKELAKGIAVRTDEQKGTIVIYVPAEGEQAAIESASKMADIAVATFFQIQERGRWEILAEVEARQRGVKEKIRALEDELLKLRTDKAMYDPRREMDSLMSRLNSFGEDLVQTELKRGELEAKLELLSRKAAQVRDTVSTQEIAALEKSAQELALQLDETSKLRRQKEIEKCEINLRQKEEEFKRIQELRNKKVVSEEELTQAEAELQLAKNDYELAKMEWAGLENRLAKVREDLAKAKEKFAETGGLELATAIAQKMLECESELAGLQAKRGRLQREIAGIQSQMAERGSLAATLERRQGEIELLNKRLLGLSDREAAMRTEMMGAKRPEVIGVQVVERIEPERPSMYNIIGEIKSPGSYELPMRTTVLQAIARAGGFTDYAKDTDVLVIRYTEGRTEREAVDVLGILKGKAEDNLILQAGDIIWVPRKGVF